MVRLDKFEIELSNTEDAYFAGQEIAGKVIIELSEPKKVNEILLELRGRARTYWTKHSGKSRKHCAHSEPYFLEQFNTNYTHKYTTTKDKQKERILPAGHHEIPFSYTLPKSLPSSFEGEYGHVRYTCKAICERPWDFDIVSKKAFTVIGIEDINTDAKLSEPLSASECSQAIAFCCKAKGSVTAELSLPKAGYTPGETINATGVVRNMSSRSKTTTFKLVQTVTYKAKTFVGHEETKVQERIVVKVSKGEVCASSTADSLSALLTIPSLCPRLGKCKIISVDYTVELESCESRTSLFPFRVDQTVTASIPIVIGSIPHLSELLTHTKHRNGKVKKKKESIEVQEDADTQNTVDENVVQVTITDESGNTIQSDEAEALSSELEALLSARKRVRMPSSILSELYPTLPSPYYRESHFGAVDTSEEKESVQYGEKMFTPKYPFYTD